MGRRWARELSLSELDSWRQRVHAARAQLGHLIAAWEQTVAEVRASYAAAPPTSREAYLNQGLAAGFDTCRIQAKIVLSMLPAEERHIVSPLDAHEGGWRCSCGRTFTSEAGYATCPDADPGPVSYSLAQIRDGTGWPAGARFVLLGDVDPVTPTQRGTTDGK